MVLAPTIATPQPDASAHADTAVEAPQPVAQAPSAAPIAPAAAPVAPATETDWKARATKLETESVPKLQSERDLATRENAELKAKVAEYESRKVPNIDELSTTIARERETEMLGWIEENLAAGFTLDQVAKKLRGDISDRDAAHQQHVEKVQTTEGFINVIAGYDEPFAKFLTAMHKQRAVVNQQTMAGLREIFDQFKGSGTPAQAAAAAAASTTPAAPANTAATTAPVEPPTVPAPNGAGPSDAPVYKKGMRSRDLFGMALGGTFGTSFQRTRRD